MNAESVLPPIPESDPRLRFEFHPWKMVLPFSLTIDQMFDEVSGEPYGYDITLSCLLFSIVFETA